MDTGVRCGDSIGVNYDPMIAKLIVHGRDRTAALAKLALALQQYQILGVNTNLGFLTRLAGNPDFIAAEFDTSFIATHHQRLFAQQDEQLYRALVLAAAALLPALDNRSQTDPVHSPWDLRSQWRMNLPSQQVIKLECEGVAYEVQVEPQRDGWHFACTGGEYQLTGSWIDQQRMRVELNRESLEFAVIHDVDSIALGYQGQAYRFEIPGAVHGDEGDTADADHPRAPMSGAVVALPVAVGDTVEPGDTLMIIEAMKMEHAIVAQVAASVSEILFAVGDQVEEGDTLVLLEVE